MKNQTTSKNLAAVLRDGLALEYVKNQTPEICLAAVRQNKCAVDLIRDKNMAKKFNGKKEDDLLNGL